MMVAKCQWQNASRQNAYRQNAYVVITWHLDMVRHETEGERNEQ